MDDSESDPDDDTAFCTWTFGIDAGTGGGVLPPPPKVDGPASIGFKSVVALFALEAGTGGGGLNEVGSESLEAAL